MLQYQSTKDYCLFSSSLIWYCLIPWSLIWYCLFSWWLTHLFVLSIFVICFISDVPHRTSKRSIVNRVWRDSFTWDMTQSYGTWLLHMGHDSFMSDVAHQTSKRSIVNRVWRDSFIWDMTQSYKTWLLHMGHDSSMSDVAHRTSKRSIVKRKRSPNLLTNHSEWVSYVLSIFIAFS